MRPCFFSMAAATRATAFLLATSSLRISTVPPALRTSAAVSASVASERPEITTRQPASASAKAPARPIPVPPPVTQAILPFKGRAHAGFRLIRYLCSPSLTSSPFWLWMVSFRTATPVVRPGFSSLTSSIG